MSRRLIQLVLLIIVSVIGIPVGLHAQSNYEVALITNGVGMGDSVSVVVCVSGHCVSISDSVNQSDTQSRQAILSRSTGEQLASSEQVTKDAGHTLLDLLVVTDTTHRDVGKPLTETLSLVESLSQVFQSNNDLWLWAVLIISLGAAIAGIAGATVALTRRKPAPFRNVPRTSTTVMKKV